MKYGKKKRGWVYVCRLGIQFTIIIMIFKENNTIFLLVLTCTIRMPIKIKTNEIEVINDLFIESIYNVFNLLRDGISFFINTINDLKKKLEKSENYIKKLESDKVLIKNNIKNIRIVSQKLLSDIKES